MQYTTMIKDMPSSLRPREKLLEHGEAALNEYELLALVLGNGTRDTSALELANQILKNFKGLRHLQEASVEELEQIKGVGPAKAAVIKAALEIGHRIAIDVETRLTIRCPEDVCRLITQTLLPEMRDYDREHFMVIYLDRKGGIITRGSVSVGGLHSSIVHPREVYKTAIKRSAASVILVHNHPSGDPAPSREDIEITRRLIEAGRIIGIEVMDHIIIGENNYCSLKEKGLI